MTWLKKRQLDLHLAWEYLFSYEVTLTEQCCTAHPVPRRDTDSMQHIIYRLNLCGFIGIYLSSSCLSASGAKRDQIRVNCKVLYLLREKSHTMSKAAHTLHSSNKTATSWADRRLSRGFLLSNLSSLTYRAIMVTVMVVCKWRWETVGGTSPCPSGLLGLLIHSVPSRHQGARACQASRGEV